eukprot:25258_1
MNHTINNNIFTYNGRRPQNNNNHYNFPPLMDNENHLNVNPRIHYNNNINDDYNYFPNFCNVKMIDMNESINEMIDNNKSTMEIDKAEMENNTNSNSNSNSNSIISNVSIIASASCHQCKTKKDVNILFYCTCTKVKTNKPHIAYKTKSIKCKKKYCTSCMTKYFNEADVETFKKYKDSISWSFDCPACQDVCTCGACKRKRAKNKNKKSK